MNRADLIAAVRAHAVDNYSKGGWDFIVECYTDEELGKLIGRARTFKGALKTVGRIVSVLAEREADARNSAF